MGQVYSKKDGGEGFCYAEETNDVLKNIRPRLPGSCWIRYTMNYGAQRKFRCLLVSSGGYISAWKAANPKGDANAAEAAAKKQGYTVTQ